MIFLTEDVVTMLWTYCYNNNLLLPVNIINVDT